MQIGGGPGGGVVVVVVVVVGELVLVVGLLEVVSDLGVVFVLEVPYITSVVVVVNENVL